MSSMLAEMVAPARVEGPAQRHDAFSAMRALQRDPRWGERVPDLWCPVAQVRLSSPGVAGEFDDQVRYLLDLGAVKQRVTSVDGGDDRLATLRVAQLE